MSESSGNSAPRWGDEEDDDDMFAPGGDSNMGSPSTFLRTDPGFSTPGTAPADPETPTRPGHRARKRAAAAAQLTPHPAHPGPSSASMTPAPAASAASSSQQGA